jgi:hypothetical protein
MTTKVADSKGRIALGAKFANKQVIIKEVDATEVHVIAAGVIPEREMWLFKNQTALQSVKRGLQQAAAGRFSKKPPDIDADAEQMDE